MCFKLALKRMLGLSEAKNIDNKPFRHNTGSWQMSRQTDRQTPFNSKYCPRA